MLIDNFLQGEPELLIVSRLLALVRGLLYYSCQMLTRCPIKSQHRLKVHSGRLCYLFLFLVKVCVVWFTS